MTLFDRQDLDLATLLVALLPPRREAAIPIAKLARMAGASKRDVETALQELASSGKFPICASTSKPYGIWLGTASEVHEYTERLQARLVHQYVRIRALRRCERAMRDASARVHQETLFGSAA